MIGFQSGSRDDILREGIRAASSPLQPRGGIQVRILPAWRDWLKGWFPAAVRAAFSTRHVRLWDWFDALTPGKKPRPRVEIWPRGGGKSSTAELGVVRVGEKGTRSFAVYVSATQGQANKHVQAIAARFAILGRGRAVNGYGNSLGWRMDLLRVDTGFNVLALGLDAAGRGVKLEDVRPDLFVLDDVDGRHDTELTVQKKIETITDSILPAGAADAAVLFVQNRIHSGSIATKLAEGMADFLLDREVFEEPAVDGLEYEAEERDDGTRCYRITGGVATWEGQPLDTCERQFNEWGRAAFLREAQHLTDESEDGLWQRARDIDPFRVKKADLPEFFLIVVGIDPNATEGGDEAGIMAGGFAKINGEVHGYLLEDSSVSGGPKAWAQEAVATFDRWDADEMVAESNNGGEMVAITIGTVPGAPRVRLIHASRGKRTRAEPVQKLAEDGRIHHVGVFVKLEAEQCTWKPGDPSPNRLDAFVWTFTRGMLSPEKPKWLAVPMSSSRVTL